MMKTLKVSPFLPLLEDPGIGATIRGILLQYMVKESSVYKYTLSNSSLERNKLLKSRESENGCE
jgi:hypothetical protein